MLMRFAKECDAGQLARLQWVCTKDLPGSFMTQLGERFLVEYHRTLLRQKSTIVLCAEEEGQIVAMVCGTLDAAEDMSALRRNRLKIALACVPALLRHPGLLGKALTRVRNNPGDDNGFIVTSGARLSLWACLPEYRGGTIAVQLLRAWLSMARVLGLGCVRLEVNQGNRVEGLHRALGARLVKTFVTPSGVERKMMEYVLDADPQRPTAPASGH